MSKNKRNNTYANSNKYGEQEEIKNNEDLVEKNIEDEISYAETNEKGINKKVEVPFLNKKGTVILAEPTYIIVVDDLGNGITLRNHLEAKIGDIVEY